MRLGTTMDENALTAIAQGTWPLLPNAWITGPST